MRSSAMATLDGADAVIASIADQRQLDAEDRPFAAVIGQALDVAGQLDEQRDGTSLDMVHLDDPDAADLELAGDGRRRAKRSAGRRRA